MYIQDVHIQNIRSITDFKMHFDNPAGWHVIIGDNGAGKTTVAQSIALVLLGKTNFAALRKSLTIWARNRNNESKYFSEIAISLKPTLGYDSLLQYKVSTKDTFISFYTLISAGYSEKEQREIIQNRTFAYSKIMEWENIEKGWFSCAFGSFRRFTGGNEEKEKLYKTHPKLGAHLSLFGEDVALSEAIPFLKYLYVRKLENKEPESLHLDLIVKFINEAKLLPNKAQIKQVTYDDIFFIDGNGQEVTVLEMSDGFRSILSLTLELIRQLVRVYGLEMVFEYVKKGENVIKTPGVVIIDEIDAHLHPTWQVKVGEWFLKYFPALQFIVTTHSPLICRACHTGTIWRLASPESDRPSGEVVGMDKDRLVYGNILDAYDTDVFGEGIERSEEGRKGLERLAYLNKRSIYGKQGLTAQEQTEYEKLKQIYQTDAIFDL
jgi:AAA15 family ATPase/GTPase